MIKISRYLDLCNISSDRCVHGRVNQSTHVAGEEIDRGHPPAMVYECGVLGEGECLLINGSWMSRKTYGAFL